MVFFLDEMGCDGMGGQRRGDEGEEENREGEKDGTGGREAQDGAHREEQDGKRGGLGPSVKAGKGTREPEEAEGGDEERNTREEKKDFSNHLVSGSGQE